MSFKFNINDLIKSSHTDITYRVVWLSENNELAYLIDVYSKSGMPFPISVSDIRMQFDDGILQKVLTDEAIRLVPEELIGIKARQFRDDIWEKLKVLLSQEKEPTIFQPKQRAVLLKEYSQNRNINLGQLYKYLRWFWKRGKNKNAFLPNYHRCGGSGKDRRVGDKKLGRPRKFGVQSGKNVDEKTKQIFETAIKRYYYTRKEYSFKAVYELMLRDFYSITSLKSDGTKELEMLSLEKIPTINQFRYWYLKRQNLRDEIKKRKGASRFELESRAITGKSDFELMGPGAKYQIDATVGDIYLVSQFNRSYIIGRPVIYLVIDSFSRMVVGIYVGLEGPSWAGAMMALANAASDKIKFCKEYGITITEEDWPCNHIPEAILGDRGEMESTSVETLINSLGVRIENAPPYRADLKGIVEQYFHTLNTTATAFLPGHVKPDMSKRGGKDYRLDAKLDLMQFTKIIIKCILYHNNEHYLESYNRSKDMIKDNVQPIPIKLWKWGITKCSGRLRSFPEDIVKLCLMPTDSATVTAKGIRFKGITAIKGCRYVCHSWYG